MTEMNSTNAPPQYEVTADGTTHSAAALLRQVRALRAERDALRAAIEQALVLGTPGHISDVLRRALEARP